MTDMIAIIDYGMGNIHSVNKALQLSGALTLVTNNPKEISSCEKAVLPGVASHRRQPLGEHARQDSDTLAQELIAAVAIP